MRHDEAKVATVRQAFEDVMMAVRALATLRGHVLGRTIRDGAWNVTIECQRCQRWATIDLAPSSDAPSVTGLALGACRGKLHGPLAAQPMRTDEVAGLVHLQGTG
jgi:hypothetical protein